MSQTYAPAHLTCVGGQVKSKIGGGRKYVGPQEATDPAGVTWTVDGSEPRYRGLCPLCGRVADPRRYWENVLLTR